MTKQNSIVLPVEWSRGPAKERPGQLDTRLHRQLERARDENVCYNENIKKEQDHLLRLGLVPLSSEGPIPSQQVQLGRWIVNLINQGGTQFIVDPENSHYIPRTDFLSWIAAVLYNIDIIVLSTARHLQVNHALSPPNMLCLSNNVSTCTGQHPAQHLQSSTSRNHSSPHQPQPYVKMLASASSPYSVIPKTKRL